MQGTMCALRGRKGMGEWRKNGVNVPWNYLRGEGSLKTGVCPFSSCPCPKLGGSTFSTHTLLFKGAVSADPAGY